MSEIEREERERKKAGESDGGSGREKLRETFTLSPSLSLPCLSHSTVEAKSYGDRKARTRGSRIRNWYKGRKREERTKKRKFRLFGASLSTVIVNGELPEILQVQLVDIQMYTSTCMYTSMYTVYISIIYHKMFNNYTNYIIVYTMYKNNYVQ